VIRHAKDAINIDMATLFDDVHDARTHLPRGLFLSRQGRWFHDEQAVAHEGLSRLLSRSVARGDDGTLIVTTGKDVLPFTAEDAPVIVREVHLQSRTLTTSLETATALPSTVFIDDTGRLHVAISASFYGLLSKSAAQVLLQNVTASGEIVVNGTTVARVVSADLAKDWTLRPLQP
jgi:hypothetical protein